MSNSIREKSTKQDDVVTVITGGMMLTDQAVGPLLTVYSTGIGHFNAHKVTFIANGYITDSTHNPTTAPVYCNHDTTC